MPEPTMAERARKLLGSNPTDGTAATRAQAWATLALVDAVDRLTSAVAGAGGPAGA